MQKKVRFLGLDVHAETIAIAVAEQDGEVRSLGVIANRAESVRKLVKKLGPAEQLRACYEAGPTGYALYWQLTELGVECAVVAPTLVPVKAGDRVKTDRRDAAKLARCHRAGDLTAVWVPDAGAEALRDLVRTREAAKQDQLRARHRLSKFLLRTGRRPPFAGKAWTLPYMAWVRQLRYEQAAQEWTRLDLLHEVEHMAERVKRLEEAIREAVKLAPAAMREVIRGLQALRGVAEISAVTVAKPALVYPAKRNAGPSTSLAALASVRMTSLVSGLAKSFSCSCIWAQRGWLGWLQPECPCLMNRYVAESQVVAG